MFVVVFVDLVVAVVAGVVVPQHKVTEHIGWSDLGVFRRGRQRAVGLAELPATTTQPQSSLRPGIVPYVQRSKVAHRSNRSPQQGRSIVATTFGRRKYE